MGKIYKSSKGREIDMDALRAQSANSPAVGNMKVNGRGDKIGPGGKIVEPVASRTRKLHRENPRVAQEISIKEKQTEEKQVDEIAENMPAKKKATRKKAVSKTIDKSRERELDDGSIEIVDEDKGDDNED